jgi:hypothetical protein
MLATKQLGRLLEALDRDREVESEANGRRSSVRVTVR